MKFEAIVANPLFLQNWSADSRFLDDKRFMPMENMHKIEGRIRFLQHMIYHLDENGPLQYNYHT
jgi:type I restriction-modification system DNA methylase subunit